MRQKKYKNIRELCIILDRTSTTIYNWIKKGCPNYVDEFGRKYFDPEEVKRWVKENIKLKHLGSRADSIKF